MARLLLELGHLHVLVWHLSSLISGVAYSSKIGVKVGHSWVASDWHKLQVVAQTLLVGDQILDSFLVLNDEGGLGEAVLLVLDELSEVDHQSPRVRLQRLESFEEYCADLLLDHGFRLSKEAQDNHAEEQSVATGVSQLIDDAVEEAKSGFIVQHDSNLLEKLDCLSVFILASTIVTDAGCDIQHYCIDHRRLWHYISIDLHLA